MPYSMAVCTPLSNFEANLNYKDTFDPAGKIRTDLMQSQLWCLFLFSQTQPLPSLRGQPHPGRCPVIWHFAPIQTLIMSRFTVCRARFSFLTLTDQETGNKYILLEKRLEILYKDPKKAKMTVLEKMKGRDLKGLEYEPLFDYFADVRFCQSVAHLAAKRKSLFCH